MVKAKHAVAVLEKNPTGIRGLDEITKGGLPKGRPTLICGSAGCGKTLFAMEFLMRGALNYGEPGVFMTFETPEYLAKNFMSLGFDLNDLVSRGFIATDHVYVERSEIEETGEYDLEGLFIRLGSTIDPIGAKRVVLTNRRKNLILNLIDYQAKYIAYELTRRFPADSTEKLTAALVDAQVDLNPHQIDTALFAFKSPLSKGALLADEVGLGKTIEAGLVLSQKWAEHKRRILIITPSNLRKQWYQELTGPATTPLYIDTLMDYTRQRQSNIQGEISARNARFFELEAEKLDGWADDLKVGLERDIKELDRQIKEASRVATAALTLEEKLIGQKQIKDLEVQRNQKRRSLFDAQDDVDRQRETLIKQIEGKLEQKETAQQLFLVRWVLA